MFEFKVGPVYEANKTSTADVVINQGGTDSSKTYSIMQLLFHNAIFTKPPLTDPIITIAGESVPNLKKGAYRVAKEIINSNPGIKTYISAWNETDRTIYFKNGWVMEFQSYTDEQSAKQGKRQYLFMNEANGMPYLVFWQLAKRTRIRAYIDYNPSAPFWAHEKLIGTDKNSNDLSATVQLIISDHRHNPFISAREHERTEKIKDVELWKVYARGLTGNLSGMVFPNWTRIPDDQFPQDQDMFGGLDFGYTNDPTAGVKMVVIGNSLFIHELCYEPGMSPTSIKSIFYANGFDSNTEIFCEHDTDQVKDLRTVELYAMLARKGPGSIQGGIAKINEMQVFYTASSHNLHTERTKYMYIMDPITGKPSNVPIDNFNHLMDAIRYGVYTKYHRHGFN
jgi:phage terminase large subunit